MSARVWQRRRTAALTAVAVAALVGPVALTSVTASAAPATAPATTTATDTAPAPGGTYVPVTPTRILDTRSGLGAPRGPVQYLSLTVLGRGGVPSSGVSAVVLNVTVTGPVAAGWLSVSAAGTASSNVNFVAGQDVAQLVVSGVAADGTVEVAASVRTQVVADVVGWFTDTDHTDAGGTFTPVASPVRAFDSRLAGAGGALRNGQARQVGLANRPSGATAAMVDLTAVHPDHQSYLSAWPGGTWTGTSSMNIAPGDIRSNRAIVPIGADGTISLVTNALTLDVVVDVTGWFGGTAGGYFNAGYQHVAGIRLFDSRQSTAHLVTLGGGDVVGNTALPLGGYHGLPRADAMSALIGVWAVTTVVSTGSTGWTAFTPSQGTLTRPPVVSSDVNWGPGATPNATILTPGVSGYVKITSTSHSVGTGSTRVDLVVDVDGYFLTRPPASVPGLWAQAEGVRDADNYAYSNAGSHPVPGDPGDVVAVASGVAGQGAALDRDGTVRAWSEDTVAGAASVLDHAAVAVGGGGYGIFVVRADGTVWTDSTAPGSRGVAGVPPVGYGPMAGVGDATTVFASDYAAWALHADGSVTTWADGDLPRPSTALRGPVRTLGISPHSGRQCTLYADGTVEVLAADGTRALATGIDAVTVAAGYSPTGCYAVDAAGRVTHLVRDTDSGVTVTAVPGPPAAQVVTTSTAVPLAGDLVVPDVRALGTDGVVRDLVDGQWVVEPGLAGATALAGGHQLLTYVPPAG